MTKSGELSMWGFYNCTYARATIRSHRGGQDLASVLILRLPSLLLFFAAQREAHPCHPLSVNPCANPGFRKRHFNNRG